jgi:hypothetical protein
VIDGTRRAVAPRDRPDPRAGTRFCDALRAARRGSPPASRRPEGKRPDPPTGRRPAAEKAGVGRQDEPAATRATGDAACGPASDAPAVAAADALRAVVRALPAAIEAARVANGAHLALAFGAALGVDLRGTAAGVEVTLRPAAALERAAAAELPALLAALSARGVRVARASVRAAAPLGSTPARTSDGALTSSRPSGR